MTVLTLPVFGWRERRRVPASLLLSLLLHLAVALALGWSPADERREGEGAAEQAVAVDIVPEHRRGGGPGEQAAPAPLPKPQLDPAPLADRAAPGEGTGADAPTPKPKPKPIDKAALRSARDVMLTQVRRHWAPPDFLRARGGVLSVRVDVRRDGTLAPPFAKDLPWNPGAAIDGFDQLPPADPRRKTLEDFYRALRTAQPFRLPRELADKLPFSVSLDFKLDDLR